MSSTTNNSNDLNQELKNLKKKYEEINIIHKDYELVKNEINYSEIEEIKNKSNYEDFIKNDFVRDSKKHQPSINQLNKKFQKNDNFNNIKMRQLKKANTYSSVSSGSQLTSIRNFRFDNIPEDQLPGFLTGHSPKGSNVYKSEEWANTIDGINVSKIRDDIDYTDENLTINLIKEIKINNEMIEMLKAKLDVTMDLLIETKTKNEDSKIQVSKLRNNSISILNKKVDEEELISKNRMLEGQNERLRLIIKSLREEQKKSS
eukprot:TRINITY_DN10199_c0_g1_i1.p1 TRINITY_DN10199_c0_g1~~TRINITY_DN10199_c0_g1_i1.p1  ORF type:complete len:260 (+),score=55.34 TRINITY_DN10199_c0_g1_i1:27-806(+)